jgi:hypothetical protein
MVNMSIEEAEVSGLVFSSGYSVTDATASMVTGEQQSESLSMRKGLAIGDKFGQLGQLTVLSRVSNDAAGRVRVRCQCKCGREAVARLSDLRRGHTKSCGCLRAVAIGRRLGKIQLRRFGTLGALGTAEGTRQIRASTEWVTFCHLCGQMVIATSSQLRLGKRRCPCLKETYSSWRNMIQRCTNENHQQYDGYGGGGVYICPEWRNSFAQFVRDMGKRPAGKTIDRYPDQDGPYTPTNCRWATKEQQAQNRN